MELAEAISTVKQYLPMLPSLGAKADEAVALVVLAAIAYEEKTWVYEFAVTSVQGEVSWLPGFPPPAGRGAPAPQRRYLWDGGDSYEYGSWAQPRENENIPRLP